jgi:hypothetical protein
MATINDLQSLGLGGGSADQIAANVLAAQWNEWQNTFQPIELEALQQNSLNNPQVLTDAVNLASTTAEGNAAAMPGMLQRRQAGLGIAPTAQQSAVSNRILNVEGAKQEAGAMNQARSNVATLDEELLLGTAAPNLAT